MTEIETAIAEELHKIAPDIDAAQIDRAEDLRDECDIDSMDFLNLVTALGQRYGLEMPEAEYPQMRTFDDLAAYIAARVPVG